MWHQELAADHRGPEKIGKIADDSMSTLIRHEVRRISLIMAAVWVTSAAIAFTIAFFAYSLTHGLTLEIPAGRIYRY